MTFHLEPVVHIPELDDLFERIEAMHAETMQALSDLLGLATLTVQGEARIMTDLSALTTEVQENSDAVDSASSLLGSLAQQIRDLATDPAALQALADELDANTDRLAEAVAANTPADPNAGGGDTGTGDTGTGEPPA